MNYLQLQHQATEFLEQDLYEQSIAIYEKCIEIKPKELSNYWHLGLTLMLQGDEHLAETVWTSVFLQANPEQLDNLVTDLVKTLNRAALKYLKSERFSEAEKLYLSILELDSDYTDAYVGLGHIQIESENFEPAVETFTRFIELDPNFSTAYYNLGFSLHNLQKYEEAIPKFQQAIILDNGHVGAYYHLGSCFEKQKKYLDAASSFKKAIDLAPNYSDAYFRLANCLYRSKKYGQAISYYKQALEIKPDNPFLLSGLANCMDATGKTEAAIEYLNKAIKINPYLDVGYHNLAFCLRNQGKIAEAIINFKKAVELNPDWIEPRYQIKKLNEAIKAGYYPKINNGYNVWDAMLFKDDNVYRLLYLGGSAKAYPFWSVGEMAMATSTDFKQWQYQGVILEPIIDREWESGRILAGSIYKENNNYYLFYSAASSEKILTEKIGLATSKDGINWERRSSTPFLELDEDYYGTYSSHLKGKKVQHVPWRDPYIVKDPNSGKYYMFLTTSLKGEDLFNKGCIGQAVADRIDGDYKLLPPVLVPLLDKNNPQESIYAELERPQIIYRNGKYNLFFSTGVQHLNPKWIKKVGRERLTESSLYWYTSDKITGPFEPVSEKPVVQGSENTGLYGTSLIEGLDGNYFACGTDFQSKTLVVSPEFPVIWEGNHLEIIVDRK